MIALQIINVKDFMNKLLTTSAFEDFLLAEASIIHGVTYHIDGHIEPNDILDESSIDIQQEITTHIPFLQIQHNIFHLIKGKQTPSYMKFVLLLSPSAQNKFVEKINSLDEGRAESFYLNILFQNGKLLLTSGLSALIFTKDKHLSNEWDNNLRCFLKHHDIFCETLN